MTLSLSLIVIALEVSEQHQIGYVVAPRFLDTKLKFFIFMPMMNMPAMGAGKICGNDRFIPTNPGVSGFIL